MEGTSPLMNDEMHEAHNELDAESLIGEERRNELAMETGRLTILSPLADDNNQSTTDMNQDEEL